MSEIHVPPSNKDTSIAAPSYMQSVRSVQSHTTAFDETEPSEFTPTSLHRTLSVETANQQRELPPRELYLVLMGRLSLAILLSALDETIVATALPKIASDLNGFEQISWVGTSYLLTSTVCQPLYGRFSDIFGRRIMILLAIVLFVLGSLGCGLAWSMTSLIIFRAISGIGGAGLLALSMVILTDIVPPKRCGQFQGAVGAIFAFASIVGPLVGGLFTDHLTWRWAFYINLPVGAITILVIIFALHLPPVPGSSKTKLRRIDWLGSFLIIATNTTLLLPTSWGGQEYAWNHPLIISLYCAGALILGATIWWEGWGCEKYGKKKPLITGSLFRQPGILAIFISVFAMGWVFFGLIYYFPMYYQIVRNYSATKSGLTLIPLILTVAVSSFITTTMTARMTHPWRFRISMTVGMIMLLVSCALLQLIGKSGIDSLALEMTTTTVAGIGVGCSIQTSMYAAQIFAERKDMATATGLVTFFRIVGGVFGIAAMGAVLNSSVGGISIDNNITKVDFANISEETRQLYLTGFRNLFMLLIPASAISMISAAFVSPSKNLEATLESDLKLPAMQELDA
ncbi:major facilitator superfamily domain-containing protein [Syncephalis fuscata]|nr:major facilitator superfamily domain-containing protein [Syncephalis fuscata]